MCSLQKVQTRAEVHSSAPRLTPETGPPMKVPIMFESQVNHRSSHRQLPLQLALLRMLPASVYRASDPRRKILQLLAHSSHPSFRMHSFEHFRIRQRVRLLTASVDEPKRRAITARLIPQAVRRERRAIQFSSSSSPWT